MLDQMEEGHPLMRALGRMVIPLGMQRKDGHSFGCSQGRMLSFFWTYQVRMLIPLSVPNRGWSFFWACRRRIWSFPWRAQGKVVILLSVPMDSGHSLGCAWGLAHYQAQRLGAWRTIKPNRLWVWLASDLTSRGLEHCQAQRTFTGTCLFSWKFIPVNFSWSGVFLVKIYC
jgi:hypothetical protein